MHHPPSQSFTALGFCSCFSCYRSRARSPSDSKLFTDHGRLSGTHGSEYRSGHPFCRVGILEFFRDALPW